MKGPLDLFFKMGEKATKGDPERQADFIYYMVWILFIAFGTMFLSNGYRLVVHKDIDYAVWTLVGFAISVIQYFSLKGMYDMKQMKKRPIKADKSLESVKDMMNTFQNEEDTRTTKSKSQIQPKKQGTHKGEAERI